MNENIINYPIRCTTEFRDSMKQLTLGMTDQAKGKVSVAEILDILVSDINSNSERKEWLTKQCIELVESKKEMRKELLKMKRKQKRAAVDMTADELEALAAQKRAEQDV